MWNPGEKSNVENLDNYLAAIVRAKEDLSKINKDIQIAIEQKELISSGNHELLNERRKEIEQKLEEIRRMKSEVSDIHSKNSLLTIELGERHKELSLDEDRLSLKKCEHENIISLKQKSLDAREEDLNNLVKDIESKTNNLEAKIKENEEIINKILDEKKSSQSSIEEFLNIKKSVQEDKDAVNEKLEDAKKLMEEAEFLKEESQRKILVAQQYLDESRKNKMESEEKLTILLKEKQSLNDLIIESKRTKMESIKSIEVAQKNIAEANLKIADLKELKEAIAQQEK